jgi:hypothetical protein
VCAARTVISVLSEIGRAQPAALTLIFGSAGKLPGSSPGGTRMADEPAHSLAEESAAAATRRGAGGFSRNSIAPGFPERILRRRPASYASCVHPIQARTTVLFALAGSRLRAERR